MRGLVRLPIAISMRRQTNECVSLRMAKQQDYARLSLVLKERIIDGHTDNVT